MNRYTFRKYKPETGVFKRWEYEYVDKEATELPEAPAGFTLFTITKL